MKKNCLKRTWVMCLCLFTLLSPAEAGDAADFEQAWNRRRQVSPFIRCRVDIVRIIPAGRLNHDPPFPAVETTVDESREFLFDTANRRIRFESVAWVGNQLQELQKNRYIWIYTPKTMQRFTFDADGNAPGGIPAIIDLPMDGRNQLLDALLRFSPPVFAAGFSPTCGLAKPRVTAKEFQFKTRQNNTVELTPVNETTDVRYLTRPDQDWAVIEAFMLVRDTSGQLIPDHRAVEVNITWEKLPQGWYPAAWQEESGDSRTCRATWEFPDDVDESLFTEPPGLRNPGNIVFTERGRRRLDHDLSLIPPDAYRESESSWWLPCLIVAIVASVALYAIRRRHSTVL